MRTSIRHLSFLLTVFYLSKQSVQCFTIPATFESASVVRDPLSGVTVQSSIKNINNDLEQETTNAGRKFFARFLDDEKVNQAKNKVMGTVKSLMSRIPAKKTNTPAEDYATHDQTNRNLIRVKWSTALQATKEKSTSFSMKVISKFPAELVQNKLGIRANAIPVDLKRITVKVLDRVKYTKEIIPAKVKDGLTFTQKKSKIISKKSIDAFMSSASLVATGTQIIPVKVLDGVKYGKENIPAKIVSCVEFTKEKSKFISKSSMKAIGAGMAATVAWSSGPILLTKNAENVAHAAISLPFSARKVSNSKPVEQTKAQTSAIASISKQTKIIIGSGVALVASSAAVVTNNILNKRKSKGESEEAQDLILPIESTSISNVEGTATSTAVVEPGETIVDKVEEFKVTEDLPVKVVESSADIVIDEDKPGVLEVDEVNDFANDTNIPPVQAITEIVEEGHVSEGKVVTAADVYVTPVDVAESAVEDKKIAPDILGSAMLKEKSTEPEELSEATDDEYSDDNVLFLSNTREKIKNFFAKSKPSEDSGVATETETAVESVSAVAGFANPITKLEKLFQKTTTPTNTPVVPRTRAEIAAARKQPKPKAEEEILAAKYAAIESLEERAFQILVDLGMVDVDMFDLDNVGEWE